MGSRNRRATRARGRRERSCDVEGGRGRKGSRRTPGREGRERERIRRKGHRPVGLVLNPKQTSSGAPSDWDWPMLSAGSIEHRAKKDAREIRESFFSRENSRLQLAPPKTTSATNPLVTDAAGVLRARKTTFPLSFIYVRPRWWHARLKNRLVRDLTKPGGLKRKREKGAHESSLTIFARDTYHFAILCPGIL